MSKFLLTLSLLFLAAPAAAAQTEFFVTVTGDQEVPPTGSTASGWARFTLNPDDTITYLVKVCGLQNGTTAHIHAGAAGVNGPIEIALSGGPTVWSGSTAPLSAGQKAALQSDGYYVNVHSTAHSAGELRGQITPTPSEYWALAVGSEEVPPVSTNATGTGMFFVNPNRTIDYMVTTQNLMNGTVAHLHMGAVGVSGPIDIALSGGPTTWAGSTAPISSGEFTTLQNLGYYLNVHNLSDPGGHIRGQMVRGQTLYGVSSPGSGGFQCALSVEGPPRPGIVVKIRITGGKPNGKGRLRVSLAPDNRMENGMCVWVRPNLVFNKAVVLNSSGSRVISTRVKNFPASRNFYLQFIGDDTPAPYASNAAFVPVEIY